MQDYKKELINLKKNIELIRDQKIKERVEALGVKITR